MEFHNSFQIHHTALDMSQLQGHQKRDRKIEK